MVARFLLGSIFFVTAGCGGKVIFVDGGGGGASSATSGTSSHAGTTGATTGTGSSCDVLQKQMEQAVAAATVCDPTIDSVQCNGSEIIPDECGCKSIVLNEKQPNLVAAAKSAYDAWTKAGCGPFQCGKDCIEAMGGTCTPTGQSGVCVGLTLD